ncbi:hypothetical protein L873DRAFT_1789387 [Choiromyces venosus 120613-1]|uniref:Hydrophobin n=1 Tax=Choiromyces venosus 120613-1 TaxID=1336337 RepID=A0A3N4JNE2_9PEZI|nr:hypothetical protein L873DRAFT_1789384 [Choiromyces venosus 120613-1]RPA99696.1 hypothetical protein L873DRAFT_1789387 [Choiromyces venosus 120613-1]
MVSIKSLAVILFAVAVSAAPAAHDEKNVNAQDNSKRCEKQEQKMFCCSDFTDTKATGIFTGVLDNIAVKCNTVPVNVWAVNAVSGQSACTAKAACCTSETDQHGLVNLASGCVAVAGAN